MTTRTPWSTLHSRAVLLVRDDVDTDQIIPARFLTTTQRSGLGAHCFADWRYDEHGVPHADFPLNQPEMAARRILVAGANFGCGSSREHAPWALLDFGFSAIVAASFADIFRSNANRNGLLTVAVGDAAPTLLSALRGDDTLELSIDLDSQRLSWGDHPPFAFAIDGFTKHALRTGLDELGMLVAELPEIVRWEAVHEGRAS